MHLSVGDRLGPYEILAPIGAGGMGEVYRARDTKLDRDVAIKVCLPALAQRSRAPGALPARSEGAGRAESSQHRADLRRRKQRALVMELVEGETLKGPLPLETALNYRQPDRRRAGSGARKGHRPSRSEAGQHQDHARRAWSRCWTSAWPKRWRSRRDRVGSARIRRR